MASRRKFTLLGIMLTAPLLFPIASPSPPNPDPEIARRKNDESKAAVSDVAGPPEKFRAHQDDGGKQDLPAGLPGQIMYNAFGAEAAPQTKLRLKREPEPRKRKFKIYPLLCG